MAFASGTVDYINELLDVFATFLDDAGWNVEANWREPMRFAVAFNGTEDEYLWRWGRRLYASKGDCLVTMQDFNISPDIQYGTQLSGGFNVGPGIALNMATAFDPLSLGDDAAHPLSFYDSFGPQQFSQFMQAGNAHALNGNPLTCICPLPSVTSQDFGTWKASTHVMSMADPDIPGQFGIPAGAPVPCQYWFFSDASGDNVMMCILRNRDDFSYIQTVTYLGFGTMRKVDTWTGGVYVLASHSNLGGFISSPPQHVTRFGPPGSMMDGTGPTTLLRADVDTFINRWLCMSKSSNNGITTGKALTSTSALVPKAGDPTPGVFGIIENGLHSTFTRRRSSINANAAALWPTYWIVERDNGNFSVMGTLPNVYQALTDGFAPGDETVNENGDTFVMFDGFAMKKEV